MQGVVRKTETGWIPASKEAQKIWDRQHMGELAKLEHVRNRNYENHKRFFELRDQTFNIQDTFDDKEVWRKQLLLMGGHVDIAIVPTPDWWDWTRKHILKYLHSPFKRKIVDKIDSALSVQYHVKSISFDEMDETEFRELFKRVVNSFLERYAPEMDDRTFMRILDFE